VPAGLGHVEFARKQHHEPTGMANARSEPRRRRTPSRDRRARVRRSLIPCLAQS
jgi:hypothetical protein